MAKRLAPVHVGDLRRNFYNSCVVFREAIGNEDVVLAESCFQTARRIRSILQPRADHNLQEAQHYREVCTQMGAQLRNLRSTASTPAVTEIEHSLHEVGYLYDAVNAAIEAGEARIQRLDDNVRAADTHVERSLGALERWSPPRQESCQCVGIATVLLVAWCILFS